MGCIDWLIDLFNNYHEIKQGKKFFVDENDLYGNATGNFLPSCNVKRIDSNDVVSFFLIIKRKVTLST